MKTILLILFVVGFAAAGYAQDDNIFSVGVKGGYTSTRFDISNYDQKLITVENKESQSGYLAGIYTRVRIFKGLSFQPEFYYAKKKGKISYSGVNNDFPIADSSYVTNVESWDLPLLVQLKLIDFEVGNIYALAGPVVSFIKSGKSDPDLGFDFNKSNWTMMLGGGVEFWRVTVDARYEWALSDVATLNNVEEFYHMLTVSVGFKIFGI